MPLLGFTVFKNKILDGTKTQTIRKIRKHKIKLGDHLYIYWHLRQKDCVKLGDATCRDVFTIRIEQVYWLGKQRLKIDYFNLHPNKEDERWVDLWTPFTEDAIEQIARLDGFLNSYEMLQFFSKHYKLPEAFQLIRWYPLVATNGVQ